MQSAGRWKVFKLLRQLGKLKTSGLVGTVMLSDKCGGGVVLASVV